MSTRMPILFIGHGSPMNAIEDNEFSKSWEVIGKSIPKPSAILCISAHWETFGTKVTAMEKPRMIYDFYGFPQELYEKQYPAPGSPELAQKVIDHLQPVVTADVKWGFDHGCWSVLCRMYPKADIPVVQLSLDHSRDGNLHFGIGKQLKFLREQGVLILGSGNVVHNLSRMVWEDTAFDWATDFDNHVREWILTKNYDPLIQFEKQGITANLSINSAEHYLPLLYILGASDPDEKVTFYNEKVWGGSLSMRCIAIGINPAS